MLIISALRWSHCGFPIVSHFQHCYQPLTGLRFLGGGNRNYLWSFWRFLNKSGSWNFRDFPLRGMLHSTLFLLKWEFIVLAYTLLCKHTLFFKGEVSVNPFAFAEGLDRPLTPIPVVNRSFRSDSLAIVEPEPYPTKTDLGSQWQIIQFLALLLLGTAINRVLLPCFQRKMSSKDYKDFPASSMSRPTFNF